ncbi:PaaI family thioesterase [Zavarzinia compransoris]|uniref:PaaI family thioesterase n=1 Tax=Zavarzinia marina TaxID=2911065 RepID=UPI001F20DBB6|nr:PaaI family thioesterase [Zavarzinia marina]MCF4166918.1 PaaI family thioesterase [Zavarzinia marina]
MEEKSPHRSLVETVLARSGFASTARIEIEAVAPGAVDLRVEMSDAVTQFDGFFHGGLIATLADCAGGGAGATAEPMTTRVVTTNLQVTFMKPARGRSIVARAVCAHPGRALRVSEVDLITRDGDKETRVATATVTLMAVP